MKDKRAVILFTDYIEDFNKKGNFAGNLNSSHKILNFFISQTTNTLLKARESVNFDIIISCNKYSKEKILKITGDCESIKYIAQKGKTFGEKYINSLKQVESLGYKEIISIGNDSPSLSPETIVNAFKKMESGYQVIVGPSYDGGFYLIGLTSFSQSDQLWNNKIFDDIDWQTHKVINTLLKNIIELNLSYYLLPKLYDIDNNKSLNGWLSLEHCFFRLIELIISFHLLHQSSYRLFPNHSQIIFERRTSQIPPPF